MKAISVMQLGLSAIWTRIDRDKGMTVNTEKAAQSIKSTFNSTNLEIFGNVPFKLNCIYCFEKSGDC